MEEEDRYTRITLRIPKDLHAKLQAASDQTSKSMNAEIIGRLESSFRIPAKVDQLIESFRSLEAVHDEESGLAQRLMEMHEAQKAVSDLQQQIIEQLLKDRTDLPKK